MAITFDSVTFYSVTIKSTFSETAHRHYLSIDASFVWFQGGPNFPIVLVMSHCDVIGLIFENVIMFSGSLNDS